MKIDLKTLLNAADTIKSLSAARFNNFKKAREISSLRKSCDEALEFYQAEYRKLLDDYAKKGEDGNYVIQGTSIELKDADAKIAFEKALGDLLNTEFTVNIEDRILLVPGNFVNSNDIPTPEGMILTENLINWDDEEIN